MRAESIRRSEVVLILTTVLLSMCYARTGRAELWLAGQLIDITKESGGEIPYGQTAITALALGPDDRIYGGTSADRPGKECYLFRYNGNDVEILGTLSPVIPDQQRIWHSLLAGPDGKMYGGTWNEAKPGEEQPAGHLFSYDVETEKIVDLGIVAKGQGIYAITADTDRKILYGVTTPSGLLFSYDLRKGRIRTIGGGAWQKRYFPPRAIICDNEGNVWGSRDQGYFFKYDVKQDKLVDIEIKMPLMIGTEGAAITEISVDALVKDENGTIYGGTYSDGYLFKFDPSRGEVVSLGKPIRQQRIRALTIGQDGMLYGVGGENNGIGKVFRYNPKNGDLRELGVIHGQGWTVYRVDTMVKGADGALYLGESSRISHLIRIKEIKYIKVKGA